MNQPGSYRSLSGKYDLHVQVDDAGLVQYRVVDSQSGEIVGQGDAGSSYQRWFFLWELNDVLWMFSSDVGGWMWDFGNNGSQTPILPGSPIVNQMPAEYYEVLPSSAKAMLLKPGKEPEKWDITESGKEPGKTQKRGHH